MPKRIGIYRINLPEKGLWRDTEALEFAFRQLGYDVSQFTVAKLGASVSTDGVPLSVWRAKLDAVVILELFQGVYDVHFEGFPTVYIPNLDWAVMFPNKREDVPAWIKTVKRVAVREPQFQVWGKTQFATKTLRAAGIPVHHVQWALPDEPIVPREMALQPGVVRFYLNAGHGGYQGRRGVDVAIAAFRLLLQEKLWGTPKLTIKLVRPLRAVKDPKRQFLQVVLPQHVTATNEVWDRARLRAELRQQDVALMPSRFEGLGLTMLEALHHGVPVIASDVAPLNEYVQHGVNGQLFGGRLLSSMRLAERIEPDPYRMMLAMKAVMRPALLNELTKGATLGLEVAAARFAEQTREALEELIGCP